MMKKKLKNLDVLMLASGVFSALLVLYFIVFVSKGYYHSDCTDTIMWAQAAVDGGKLTNEDFSYACLLPFGGQLLMVPFVALFGVGMTSQLAGMVIFTVLFAASIVFLLRSMGIEYKWCSVAVSATFLILSSSQKLREIYWCHIIYYSLGILFLFVGLGIANRIINEEGSLNIKNVAALLVWTCLCSMNGVPSLTIYVLPVLAAVVTEAFFDFKKEFKENIYGASGVVVSVMTLGMVVGLLLGKIVNGDVTAGYQKAFSKFSESSDWLEHLLAMPLNWLTLLGVNTNGNMLMYSTEGMTALIKIFCCLVILFAPLVIFMFYKKINNKTYRIMIWVNLYVTALIMVAWVFGGLSNAEWRLSPFMATSVITCIIFIRVIIEEGVNVRVFAVIALPMAILTLITVNDIFHLEPHTESNKQVTDVAGYIERQNLEYGYGTFWNANVITLLSDSKVKVRTIEIDENGLVRGNYQTNKKWYDDDSHNEYFVLLTNSEFSQYSACPNYIAPKEILQFENYILLTYDYNVMNQT